MKSILQQEKQCFVCQSTRNLEEHHVLFGPLKKVSERWGLKVWLCEEHHRGNYSPHKDAELDLQLKQMAEVEFLKNGSIGQWMDVKSGIGRNYL